LTNVDLDEESLVRTLRRQDDNPRGVKDLQASLPLVAAAHTVDPGFDWAVAFIVSKHSNDAFVFKRNSMFGQSYKLGQELKGGWQGGDKEVGEYARYNWLAKRAGEREGLGGGEGSREMCRQELEGGRDIIEPCG
jgi:hypothetical protein